MKKIVIVLILSMFVSTHLHAKNDVSWLDGIAAIVNDDVITEGELQKKLDGIIKQLQRDGKSLPAMSLLKKQVLERMILTSLQYNLAERTGIRIDDVTLDNTIENIATQNKLTIREFHDVLTKDGIDFADFREEIRKELTLARLRQREVDNRILVTKQDVDNYLLTQKTQQGGDQEYRLQHILMALPEGVSPEQLKVSQKKAAQLVQQLREGSDFSEMAIAHSAGQKALDGGDWGWRKLGELPRVFAEIVVKMAMGDVSDLIRSPSGFHIIKLAEKRSVSTQRNVIVQRQARHILIKPDDRADMADSRVRLDRLRERIVNGEDFAEIAKIRSDDPGSAVEGGSLGWVNPGVMVPEFEEEMDKLADGEISPVFQSRFGWHIVQVLEHRDYDNTEELQQIAAQKAIKQRLVEEEYQLWLRRLRDEAFVELKI
ncbi:Periplasmic chaperone and peptidyl-prolyl cis-trans isomerase of outer membrane proteins SurA [hydrothermal vent metagenome]|uniref:Periplasmic chaperone and peptidyl-prolyl cis-trans isomerase of outer membrane proteins SurA n=1 Tax=hydrothermal vent metagenome TaxID=652676 RepID=A0A3B0ZRU2_9ZZZZ